MGNDAKAGHRGSDVDAIAISGMRLWQVHLGRSGGKLITKEELEAAVARDEIGLETLVREPGALSWTTAGAATGRSAPPESPPEPEYESDRAIEISQSDLEVDVAPAAPPPPNVAKVEPPLTKEEIASTKPKSIGVLIVAGIALVSGVLLAATTTSWLKRAKRVEAPPPAMTLAAPAMTIASPVASPATTSTNVEAPAPSASVAPSVPAPAPPQETKAKVAVAPKAPPPAHAPRQQPSPPKAKHALPPPKAATPQKPIAVSAHAEPNKANKATHPTPPRPEEKAKAKPKAQAKVEKAQPKTQAKAKTGR